MSIIQTTQIRRFAEIFKALSNPHRLDIFLRLASCCPLGTKCTGDAEIRQCVGELAKGVSIDPSTVSHHLKELRRSGLIHMERNGRNIECWVDPEVVHSLANLLIGGPSGLMAREQDSIS
jgi:ArsR family transcriptional regulator, arsenate/arsenite/antimonite-responsive transcriptional repressor